MSKRDVQYLDPVSKTEVLMPITPESYTIIEENAMETVNIYKLGDVTSLGYRKAVSWTDKYLLPAHKYSFINSGASIVPRKYIKQLLKWQRARTPLQYIIAGANVNKTVYINRVEYTEDDGTNNVKMNVTVTRAFTRTSSITAGKDVSSTVTITYNIKTMSFKQLANKYYGDTGLSSALLKYNGYNSQSAVRNGAKIKIPPKKQLN